MRDDSDAGCPLREGISLLARRFGLGVVGDQDLVPADNVRKNADTFRKSETLTNATPWARRKGVD